MATPRNLTKLIQGQSRDIKVRHIVLILSARDSGDIPGGGDVASLAEGGLYAAQCSVGADLCFMRAWGARRRGGAETFYYLQLHWCTIG